jgi:hypothetical protein
MGRMGEIPKDLHKIDRLHPISVLMVLTIVVPQAEQDLE